MTKTLMIFGMLGWDAHEGETELAAPYFRREVVSSSLSFTSSVVTLTLVSRERLFRGFRLRTWSR